MPHANIWIRKENIELWNNVENKSEFINTLLSKESFGLKVGHENLGRLQDEIQRRVVVRDVPVSKRNTAGFCKEGHPIPEGRDRCMGKGCKYS